MAKARGGGAALVSGRRDYGAWARQRTVTLPRTPWGQEGREQVSTLRRLGRLPSSLLLGRKGN